MAIGSTDEETGLLYDAWLTEGKEVTGISKGYLRLEFITRKATIGTGPLNSKVAAFISDAHTHGTPVSTTDISLRNMRRIEGERPISVAFNKEFTFNFLCHK